MDSLKSNIKKESFGLSNIGMTSESFTGSRKKLRDDVDVGNSRITPENDFGRGKRIKAPVSVSREVFTLDDVGLGRGVGKGKGKGKRKGWESDLGTRPVAAGSGQSPKVPAVTVSLDKAVPLALNSEYSKKALVPEAKVDGYRSLLLEEEEKRRLIPLLFEPSNKGLLKSFRLESHEHPSSKENLREKLAKTPQSNLAQISSGSGKKDLSERVIMPWITPAPERAVVLESNHPKHDRAICVVEEDDSEEEIMRPHEGHSSKEHSSVGMTQKPQIEPTDSSSGSDSEYFSSKETMQESSQLDPPLINSQYGEDHLSETSMTSQLESSQLNSNTYIHELDGSQEEVEEDASSEASFDIAQEIEKLTSELEWDENLSLATAEDTGTAPDKPSTKEITVKSRAYQQEMFEASLKENIIVCQGTGSGKTYVAILRIRHEIEHSPPHRMSWFLAPNRQLAEQQFDVLQAHLPPVPMKYLSGDDGVEKWDSGIWDEILSVGDTTGRVKVVVSTHQILLDALAHGYVTMDELSLIIFDEAHHCISEHPANRIMRLFYHTRLAKEEYVPAILGLTASPIFNGSVGELQKIEFNLNARCRTPMAHRTTLNQHLHLPTLRPVAYTSLIDESFSLPSLSLPSLEGVLDNMDIFNDPYVKSLPRETERDEITYQKTLNSGTYSSKQMKSFVNKAQHVFNEYGSWAADFYIDMVVNRFMELVKEKGDELVGWVDEEKVYLMNILSEVKTFETSDRALLNKGALTPKVEKLIDVLVEEYEKDMARGEQSFSGIIFVEQRVGVSMLGEILSRHPRTKDIFRCGALVGTSQHIARTGKNLAEIIDPKKTKSTLADFRTGDKNLIIATSVAEEGLDIQACHLVICCYMQKTRKSYVQMRGRARRKDSTYILMFPDEDVARLKLREFDIWEKEMLEAYQDEARKIIKNEETDSDEEGTEAEKLYIPETKALLTYDFSIPHLHHFCAVIPHSQYIDFRPDFYTRKDTEIDGKLWTSDLTLPSCIQPELRVHKAKYAWKQWKMAEKDVAFQAYVALHKSGLVDNHLMPLPTKDPEIEMDEIAKKTSTEAVAEQMDPFVRKWEINEKGEVKAFISSMIVTWENGEIVRMKMILPFACPKMENFNLWWTNSEAVQVTVNASDVPTYVGTNQFSRMQKDTYNLLSAVFPGKVAKGRQDFSYLFTLEDGEISAETIQGLDMWSSWNGDISKSDVGIVRDKRQQGKLYLFKRWNHEAIIPEEVMEKRYFNQEQLPDVPLLEVTPVPKRRNFLHRFMNTTEVEEEDEERARIRDTTSTLLLPQLSAFDCVPWRVARATLLIPCILRKLEVHAIAKELQETVMAPVGFTHLPNVITAIMASSAREDTNYQRYELLGDSVLKFLTGLQLLADYPLWHEGYLSGKKDRSVANSKLAQESMRLKMSRFIVTNLFSPSKWRIKYSTTEVDMPEAEKGRQLSTKILADVVESLIGAAYLEGSFDKALKVAQVFGLSMKWDTLETRLNTLYNRAIPSEGMHFPVYLQPLESLLGYTFTQKPLLLEAITHPSNTRDTTFVSYQRMEFLGDSVLDMAIVDKLFRHEKKFSHVDMHLYKSASVNEYFLGFLCLNHSLIIEDGEKEAQRDPKTNEITLISKDKFHYLFRFLRHDNLDVAKMQESAWNNFSRLKEDIFKSLREGKDFPWTLLAGINAEKFFSDLVESILGAVFIDSHGSFDAVNAVIGRLGLFDILDRSLKDGVDPRQPVSKLGIFAAQRMKQSRTKYVQGIEGGKYFCEVMVNEEVIVREVGGVSREEVQIKAAEKAYELLVEREGGEGISEEVKMGGHLESEEESSEDEMEVILEGQIQSEETDIDKVEPSQEVVKSDVVGKRDDDDDDEDIDLS